MRQKTMKAEKPAESNAADGSVAYVSLPQPCRVSSDSDHAPLRPTAVSLFRYPVLRNGWPARAWHGTCLPDSGWDQTIAATAGAFAGGRTVPPPRVRQTDVSSGRTRFARCRNAGTPVRRSAARLAPSARIFNRHAVTRTCSAFVIALCSRFECLEKRAECVPCL